MAIDGVRKQTWAALAAATVAFWMLASPPPIRWTTSAVVRCADTGWLCRATRFFCGC